MRLFIVVLLSTLAFPALAQPPACKPLDKMRADLASSFQETLAGVGITDDGNLLMRFESKDGATWTVVLVNPQKVACIMDFGTQWQASAPEPEGEGL